MKKIAMIFLTITLAVTLSACGTNQLISATTTTGVQSTETKDEIMTEQQLQTIASNYVQAFLDGDIDTMMSFAMIKQYSDAMTKDKLSTTYEQLAEQLGEAKRIVSATRIDSGDYNVYSVISEYEKANMEYTVSLDKQGRLAGLFVKPYTGQISDDNANFQSDYITREVSFGKAPYTISGTLTLPAVKSRFPAVVLVHGSGPNDRDETIYDNKPFRDLAEGLATYGIASLRYDKRTYVYSQQLATLQASDNLTIYDETVDDAVYAVEYLKSEDQIDSAKIFVIGHSLGANQAPRIAQKAPSVAGLVMMAGNVTYMQDLIAVQIPYLSGLDGTVTEAEQQSIDAAITFQQLLNSGNYTADTPANLTLGVGYNYWKDLYQYNPVTIAQTLDIPMLVLQGTRDYQVTAQELDKWRDGLGDKAQYQLYDGLNHLFIYGEGIPGPEEYKIAGHIDQQVIADIAAFINAQ